MSFRGELREFELPDILQLIASQNKAGWLKVISRGKCHFVFFRDGKITSTRNPADETDPFEEYIEHLTGLLPRHRGALERRVEPVDGRLGTPDALIVMSFPDSPSVDGFLRDPLRADAEDLAARAVSRSVISDGRLQQLATPTDLSI